MPTNIHFIGGGHVRVDAEPTEAATQGVAMAAGGLVEFEVGGKQILVNPATVTHYEQVGRATAHFS